MPPITSEPPTNACCRKIIKKRCQLNVIIRAKQTLAMQQKQNFSAHTFRNILVVGYANNKDPPLFKMLNHHCRPTNNVR